MAWKQVRGFDPGKMGTESGMCLKNCRIGYDPTIPAKYVDAKAAMEANRNAGTLHDMSSRPTNCAVPVFADTSSPNEHVMVYYYNTLYSDGQIVSNPNSFKYFGWGETLNDVRVVKWVEDPKPVEWVDFPKTTMQVIEGDANVYKVSTGEVVDRLPAGTIITFVQTTEDRQYARTEEWKDQDKDFGILLTALVPLSETSQPSGNASSEQNPDKPETPNNGSESSSQTSENNTNTNVPAGSKDEVVPATPSDTKLIGELIGEASSVFNPPDVVKIIAYLVGDALLLGAVLIPDIMNAIQAPTMSTWAEYLSRVLMEAGVFVLLIFKLIKKGK